MGVIERAANGLLKKHGVFHHEAHEGHEVRTRNINSFFPVVPFVSFVVSYSGLIRAAPDLFGYMRILSRHRIRDCFFQRSYAVPFSCRPHAAVAADLVDAPVDFQ